MDDIYQDYVNRVAKLTLLETYKSQLEYIDRSPKFKELPDSQIVATPFPGYSAITPPASDDRENSPFYELMQKCQKQLLEVLGGGLMVPMPTETFHLTVADLIWENAFLDASKNPDFEQQLRSRIQESFTECIPSLKKGPEIRWQVLGIMLRTRAVAVSLVPKDESSYEQILQIRRSIYQNSSLIGLGIEQQYHFTPHITLGYFVKVPQELDRDRLASSLLELNNQWLGTTEDLWVHRVELRKFDDMTHFYHEPDWPVLEL